MTRTIKCYGVRDYEIQSFNELGQKYNYRLDLEEKLLTKDNIQTAFGYEIIMIRGNCILDRESLKALSERGLKYILTRTIGYDHIDLNASKEFDIKVANTPNYSPNSVAELAVTFALMLLRNVSYITNNTSNGDFRINSKMFSKEIRDCTVGIIGCGRIGYTVSKLFYGLCANVIAYDVKPKDNPYVKFMELDEVIKKSDIITLHLPYFNGQNDNLINSENISKMKDGAIIINTSRGELLDLNAAVNAIKSHKLGGLAIDVIQNEHRLFFQKWDKCELENTLYKEIIDLYPSVLVTPHIGSSTKRALYEMIEISLQNMDEYNEDGNCHNSVVN